MDFSRDLSIIIAFRHHHQAAGCCNSAKYSKGNGGKAFDGRIKKKRSTDQSSPFFRGKKIKLTAKLLSKRQALKKSSRNDECKQISKLLCISG